MKKLAAVLASLVVLSFCSTSHAAITNVTYASDNDGAFNCTPWTWTGWTTDPLSVSVSGDQYWAPGHLLLNVLTTGAEDPTLNINNSINNDTSFAWTEFTVNLTMAVPFTLSNVGVTVPGSWGVVSYDATANPVGPNYVATVVYDTGAAIPNDGTSTIDFGYSVHFSGSPSYTITQEMIPVPEPGTLGLVGVGALLLVQSVRHRRGVSRG